MLSENFKLYKYVQQRHYDDASLVKLNLTNLFSFRRLFSKLSLSLTIVSFLSCVFAFLHSCQMIHVPMGTQLGPYSFVRLF